MPHDDAHLNRLQQTRLDSTTESGPAHTAPGLASRDISGQTIAHYKLESKLGAGGMGEVYLARDLALGRQAAVKVLPAGFDPGIRERLLREAEISARVQHPGIVTFYETGQDDNRDFIAMEFVRGETLREVIGRERIPCTSALQIIAEVLEALVHAHHSGILHRDIKPENIMVTSEGAVKLLDFGLAKALLGKVELAVGTNSDVSPADADTGASLVQERLVDFDTTTVSGLDANLTKQLTFAGSVLGTLGYMSPEQLRGRGVDERSDIFAVGAVLYELLSGKTAFPGHTVPERVNAILHCAPEPLTSEHLPTGLDQVVLCALARDPDRRYQSAASFLRELRPLGVFNRRGSKSETVGIIEFVNRGENSDAEWLSSAIPDAIRTGSIQGDGITFLSREEIIAVCQAAAAASETPSPMEYGLRLACSTVITGNFEYLDKELKVDFRMTDVATGGEILHRTYRGSIAGMLEEAALVAASANARHENAHFDSERQLPRAEAFECYARGRRIYFQGERNQFPEARRLLERAIELEPDYAQAHVTLAYLMAMTYNFSNDPADLDCAERHVCCAIAIDSDLGEAHMVKGYIHHLRRQLPEALAAAQRAVALDPHNVWTNYVSGSLLELGRPADQAATMLAVVGDPGDVTDIHAYLRRTSVERHQRTVQLNPVFTWSWLALGWGHMELRNFREARWCLKKAIESEDRSFFQVAGVEGFLGECLRREGHLSAAHDRFMNALQALERKDHMYRDTWRGIFLCGLGRTALQQEDHEAARAAFTQASLHVRGRPRARCCGHVLVQALAGLTRAGAGPEPLAEALKLYEKQTDYDFGYLWGCSDDVTLLELSRAARALGQAEQADALLAQAVASGSTEGRAEIDASDRAGGGMVG